MVSNNEFSAKKRIFFEFAQQILPKYVHQSHVLRYVTKQCNAKAAVENKAILTLNPLFGTPISALVAILHHNQAFQAVLYSQHRSDNTQAIIYAAIRPEIPH